MKLEDIKKKITLKCVQNLGIDVEPFSNLEELRVYIKLNQARLYQKKNAQYFRDYMKKRYYSNKQANSMLKKTDVEEKNDVQTIEV